MYRTWLLACLLGILTGCAGANHRAPKAPVSGAHGAADAGWSTPPPPDELVAQPCEERELSLELAKFTEMSLWEVWEEMARVGAAGIPPLASVDTALLPRRLLRGLGTAPGLCEGVHQDPANGAILLMPTSLHNPPQEETAAAARVLSGTRLAQGARFWARVDRGRLVNQVRGDGPPLPVQRELPRLLVPLGRGSLIRFAAPRFGAQSGVLLQGQPEEPARLNRVGSSVVEDLLDYRFRLPDGTARVLILKF